MTKRPAGELLSEAGVVQLFRATADYLSVISPVMATYRRQVRGRVWMALYRLEPGAGGAAEMRFGAPLAVRDLPGAELEDNDAVDLTAEPLLHSAGQVFALVLGATGAAAGAAATVWLTDGPERIAGHLACYVGGKEQGSLGVQAASLYCPEVTSWAVPRAILYSPVSQCNLNCIHCISRPSRAKAERLSSEIKSRLRDYCREGALTSLVSDYSGDLLWADHRYPGELAFVLELGIPFHIDTNGVYLTAENSALLARSRLQSLNISLDAARDETFRRVRRGAPALQEVIENVRGLVRARAEAGAGFMVSLGFTLMRSTLDEWTEILHLAASLGVEAVIARHVEAYTADMAAESLWLDKARYNSARLGALRLGEVLGLRLGVPPPFDGGRERTGHRACGVAWHSAVILGNGDVAACCVPGLTMGNLHENSLEEIWNGARYRNLRCTVNTSEAPAQCQACPMQRLTNNPDSYLFYRVRERQEARKT